MQKNGTLVSDQFHEREIMRLDFCGGTSTYMPMSLNMTL